MNSRIAIMCSIIFGLFASSGNTQAEILKRSFEGFTVWIDCERNGAVLFEYTAVNDSGPSERPRDFKIDATLPDDCRQTGSDRYSGSPPKYDRGHLVPAMHLGHLADAARDSNIMSNILPQAANMNRGAWLKTEEIIECYRVRKDMGDLRVIGGIIWGFNPHDDKFLETHGVATPDYFWKVVISQKKNDVIAWIIPNVEQAKRKNLDRYLVSLAQIQDVMASVSDGPDFGRLSEELMNKVHQSSWPIPDDCEVR